MTFQDILNKVKTTFGVGNNQPVSPVPQIDTLSQPWQQQYVAQQQQQPTTPATSSKMEYPAWMGNAPASPSGSVLAAQYAQPSPTPTSVPSNLAKIIKQGIEKYDKNSPVATLSAELAQAGHGLPDSLLPTILSLIETHGGRDITKGKNNYYNALPTRAGVNYPDPRTAILGGNGQKGLYGLLTSGLYDKYLKSGKLEDFFSRYSPASENASIADQVDRYNSIKDQYFTP